jgi:sugar lactone lactonase YvrE
MVPPALADPLAYSSLLNDGVAMLRLDLATGDIDLLPAGGGAYGLALSPSGVLYGALPGPANDALLALIAPDGASLEVIGSLAVDCCFGGIAFDAAGRLWLATYNGQIFEVDPATAELTLAADTRLSFVAGLTACDDRLIALVTELSPPFGGRLMVIDPETGASTPLGPESPALLTVEGGVDFDSDGRLWAVLDRANPIPDPTPIDAITEFDPATGEILSQIIVQTVGSSLAVAPPPAACAFGGGPVVEVPVLGRGALVALAALLALAGGWALRRR